MDSKKTKIKTLGILGSGQLARMTAIAAQSLGIEVHIFCDDKNISPASHVASTITKGSFSNLDEILKFCMHCDIVTLENEFIDQEILNQIDLTYPDRLHPNSKTFNLIGDKLSEKNHFRKEGIKVAPYKEVQTEADILSFIEHYQYPVVLKTSKGGYDGFGNFTIKKKEDITIALQKLKGQLIVEAFIPFEKELAIMIARNSSGDIKTYPIAHTEQENHICHFVNIPAEIDLKLSQEITEMAIKSMVSLKAVGIFAFEFFVTKNNEVYLNETAPRPHNSGHYSIEGCQTSQFENHVRAVLNYPLGETTLQSQFILMLNLLGTHNGDSTLKPIEDFLKINNGHLHLYGKQFSKTGRKMGHYTLLGDDKIKMKNLLTVLKQSYSI
jgi:5-(carboxyamino)imidazole ribonucleotide synthase